MFKHEKRSWDKKVWEALITSQLGKNSFSHNSPPISMEKGVGREEKGDILNSRYPTGLFHIYYFTLLIPYNSLIAMIIPMIQIKKPKCREICLKFQLVCDRIKIITCIFLILKFLFFSIISYLWQNSPFQKKLGSGQLEPINTELGL